MTATETAPATEQKPTARQAAILAHMTEAGWTIKRTEFIGAKVWVVIEKIWKGTGNVFLDKSMFGTIGPRGALNLEYMQFNIKDKVTESWQLRSRLAD